MIAAASPSPAATPWFHSLDWERLLETYGVPLLAAIVVLLAGMWVARRLSNAMPRATARMGVDPMLGSFLRNVVYAASLVIVVVLAIGTLGVQITPLLAVLGTAGLAVGLALKDSLSNIASGVMLVTLRPFRVGDVVTVAGQTGTVREVRIFQTVLTGADIGTRDRSSRASNSHQTGGTEMRICRHYRTTGARRQGAHRRGADTRRYTHRLRSVGDHQA